MIIGYPRRFETFGAVEIYELTKVQTLLSVASESKPGMYSIPSFKFLEDTMSETVFIVPVRNEDTVALDNVIRAIPYYSPVIVVSNSEREPFNLYKIEQDIARTIYRNTGRQIIVVHQKDKVIADYLKNALPEIIGEDSLVKSGKGEGALIGVLLADGLRAKNVAFVDADNYIPSVVLEYALIYYTTLSMSESRYTMVRISWGYKAWAHAEEGYYRRTGRVSAVMNNLFNRVLSLKRRIETDIVRTANSGEHAMTIELARELVYGSRFSLETQELVSILEKCYVKVDKGECPSLPGDIEIYQVESLSPHIHAEKGEAHVLEMLLDSISSLYYSDLPDEKGKSLILSTLRDFGVTGEPPVVKKYTYPKIDARKFLDTVISESQLSLALGF